MVSGARWSAGRPFDEVAEQVSARLEQQQVRRCLDTLTDLQREFAGDGQVFAKLAEATHHMPMTAATLAGGIAENKILA